MSFVDRTVRAHGRQPSIPDPGENLPPDRERPTRLAIDDTAARANTALSVVAGNLTGLDASTLRVFLAAAKLLIGWRRAGDAVDVAALGAAAGVSERRVYSALAVLTDLDALTWTATGPRSGVIGLPATPTRPSGPATWDFWDQVSAAAKTLIDAVLARHVLEDGAPAPAGWVVKRGAGGSREASAPVSVLRLATALLAATWPAQSPTVPTTAVNTVALGKPDTVWQAWRWLAENAGVAYTPRRGRGMRGVGLPGYTDELPADTPQLKSPYVVNGSQPNPPTSSTPNPPTSAPIPISQVDLPRTPLPPKPEKWPSTHSPVPREGRGKPHEKPTDSPDLRLSLAAAALAVLGLSAPRLARRWTALLRCANEEIDLLVAAGWTADDVSAWLGADVARQPVDATRVRDPNRFTAAMLGKVAEAAAAGVPRPTVVKARAEAEAAARAAAVAAERAERDAEDAERQRTNRVLIAEAMPHLARISPDERVALLPRKTRRRPDECADLGAMRENLLLELAWGWHTHATDDELAAAGWEVVADAIAGTPDGEWLAEKLRTEKTTALPYASYPLREAWCRLHHDHERGV